MKEAIIKKVHMVGLGLYNSLTQTKLENRRQAVTAG